MKVAKIDDLNPDGLKITVDWESMDVGMSFFLPCIDIDKAKKQVKSVAKMKDFGVEIRIVIEDKKLGWGGSKLWDKVRENINWFRKNNAEAYMVLLD